MNPADFNGLVRSFATVRPRDVAPGKVPCLVFADEPGQPPQECDLDAPLVEAARVLARAEGFTLDQMLARQIVEIIAARWQQWRAENE